MIRLTLPRPVDNGAAADGGAAAGSSDDEMPLPGYDVVELLGRGCHGEVWLARERATGWPVALNGCAPTSTWPPATGCAARRRSSPASTIRTWSGSRGVHGDGGALVLVLDLPRAAPWPGCSRPVRT